jgi:hypothetical protein
MIREGNLLVGTVRAVRRRRLWALALRGIAISLAAGSLILLAAGLAAQRYRYSDQAILGLRLAALIGFAAVIYYALVRPLSRRISDAQIARLIEERTPNLGDRLVTAIEFSDASARLHASPAIIERLVEDAERRAAEIVLDRVIPRRRLWSYAGAALACLLFLASVLLWGPRSLYTGVARLVQPSGSAATSAGDRQIQVRPGSARVPKGSDQQIVATLVNFDAEEVTFFERPAGSEAPEVQWVGRAMEEAKNKNEYQYFIFNIQESTEYFIEANGIKSQVFKLDVADLPYVKRIDLLLNFPAYTRLAAKTIEDGDDIAALKGTVVQITARLTGKARAARIVLRDGRKVEMRPEGETDFVGQITITGNTSYHIELVSVDDETYNGSNERDITVLEDRPPVVTFEKPGRDTKATSVEEVFTQAKAEDDYGVLSLEMYYSVNGGQEKKVTLQNLKADAARSLSGTHTFFMEELGLQPGDFVSYYAKARDASSEATSDIYFIEIRPFELQFKQAQQQGGDGAGGGQDQNALTRRQKEIIAATFRLMREEATATPEEKADNHNTVALGQERLRDDTRALIDRIKRRMGDQLNAQQEFAKLVEHLTQAAQEMEAAIKPLKDQKSKDALPPEQRALQQLLRADSIFREIQVAFGNQSGGGGGSAAQAEELADLFELELDKMKNQYETLRREQRQRASQQADEAQRKLEELSRRLQQAMEQHQRRQQGQPRNSSGGGGGSSQRQQQELIDEARRAARELERLSRERRDQRMQEVSRQLNQAADELQKAQAASSSNNPSEAAAQTARALERLEEAQRRLQRAQQGNRNQSVEELRQRAADALNRQREIMRDVEELARRGNAGDASAKGTKERLNERKESLASAVNELEQDIDRAARGFGRDQQKAGEQLREAAASLRRNRVSERIRNNRQNIENNQYEAARAGERAVEQNLNELANRLRAAEESARQSGGSGEDALDRTRQLADNLESLRRRLSENQGQQNRQTGQQQGQTSQQTARQNGQQQSGRESAGRPPNGQQRGNQPGNQQQRARQQNGQQPNGQQQGRQPGGQQAQGGSPQDQNGQPQPANSEEAPSQNGQVAEGTPFGGGRPLGGDRQLGSELRERLREAEELRRQLGRAGDLGRELDRAIEQLRRLNDGAVRDDTETAALLKSEVIDPLRQIELELSRRLQAKLGRSLLRLGGEGVAPERYRKLVDEYYKRLSSRPTGP